MPLFVLFILTFLSTALATTTPPVVSDEHGVIGEQFLDHAHCNPAKDSSCIQVTNNLDGPISIGVSFRHARGQGGKDSALITRAGKNQCVFTQEPTGTVRCVSVLNAGEQGWLKLPPIPSKSLSVTITEWEVTASDRSFPDFFPGTMIPVTVLGDPVIMTQGQFASSVNRRVCPVDLRVRGSTLVTAGMCR